MKALPKFVPWLDRNSPYYNLISDESQIWQGERGGQAEEWSGMRAVRMQWRRKPLRCAWAWRGQSSLTLRSLLTHHPHLPSSY